MDLYSFCVDLSVKDKRESREQHQEDLERRKDFDRDMLGKK